MREFRIKHRYDYDMEAIQTLSKQIEREERERGDIKLDRELTGTSIYSRRLYELEPILF